MKYLLIIALLISNLANAQEKKRYEFFEHGTERYGMERVVGNITIDFYKGLDSIVVIESKRTIMYPEEIIMKEDDKILYYEIKGVGVRGGKRKQEPFEAILMFLKENEDRMIGKVKWKSKRHEVIFKAKKREVSDLFY